MFCPECSTELPDEAKFCIKCRYDFTKTKTPPPKKQGQDSFDGLSTSIQPEMSANGFRVGTLFADRYEILSEGHKGGMGEVYKCRDTMLNNKIKALKVIHPRLLSSHQALSRFRQEVAISQELQHENIVRVYDIEEWEGKEYFTMEWVEGISLREIITERKEENRPFSIEEAYKIISQLSNALHHAHRHTIHRDIKPENILITDGTEQKVKLTDFGIAKMLSPSQFTSTSMQMGTPYYMAPEQKVDAGNVDKRADIYALGVVLFELLTLENTIGLELPSELNKDLPSVIDPIIKRAVATKPDDRYGEAKELSEALKKVVDSFSEQAQITRKESEKQKRREEEQRRRDAEELKQKENKEQAENERRVREKEEAEQKRIENEQRLQVEQNEAGEKAEKEKLSYGRKAVYIIVGVLVLVGAYNYFISRQRPSNGLEIQSPTPGSSPAPAPEPAPAPRPAPVEAPSNNSSELLPPLQVSDYFVYDMIGYEDGKITLQYTIEEKVVGTEKTANNMAWVVLSSSRNKVGSSLDKIWIDQKTGLWVKYESEFNHSTPGNYLINNKSVKAVRSKRIISNDIQQNTMEQKTLVTDITGYTHEISAAVSNPPLSVYKITRQLKTGDWYPWKTSEYGRQVLDVTTISVPAGTFTCWMIKLMQSEGHQHYFDYYDISTGLLVRHDNMVNKNGQWQMIEKKELKEYHFSHKTQG